ncbi:glutathione S-transferase U8-like [Corylus avellana]|uniref:glutathione S-transferase U8-like n=1 Tax=Corylus avellana TaxID=13451 RepID=UPI00286D0733|nr:glutathione S-transferase U8-like [Corylus avellana]
MAEEVVLHGLWASPYSRRVEVALKLKGVQYKYIEEDLSNKSPSLLKYNPVHKMIPILVHNGKPIVDSDVILEYIEETWQEYPLLPEDHYERARARFWRKFIDNQVLLAALLKAFWGEENGREKALEEASGLLNFLEEELKEKKFFGGERIGMVDIVANVIGFWIGTFEEGTGIELLTVDKFPKLCNWVDEYLSSSVIKENLPPKDKLIPFVRFRFGGTSASK